MGEDDEAVELVKARGYLVGIMKQAGGLKFGGVFPDGFHGGIISYPIVDFRGLWGYNLSMQKLENTLVRWVTRGLGVLAIGASVAWGLERITCLVNKCEGFGVGDAAAIGLFLAGVWALLEAGKEEWENK